MRWQRLNRQPADLLGESKEKVLKVAQDFGWQIALTAKAAVDAPLGVHFRIH